MFKLTVEQVLESIAALTSDEKAELQVKLPTVLSLETASSIPQSGQSQSFRDISMTGEGHDFSATQANRDVILPQRTTQASKQNTDLQEAISVLEQLKQDVNKSNTLNQIEKVTVEVPIQVIEAELKKQEPDKSLVDQAIVSLKKGLEGVQTLAEPVMKVAALIAKAWVVL
jgi:hypothetical protein